VKHSPTVSDNNITRDEARARAALLNVASYAVDLDLRGAGSGDRTFRSETTVAFTCTEPGASTHIDITADRIVEATLNGRPIDESAFTGHRLQLDGLRESNELRVVADCVYMRTGEGLHRFIDPVDDGVYLYTQFETFDAHRMYACFDQPDLKASYEFRVIAPADWVVVSNTQARVEDAAGGGSRWLFTPTARMSTYITALVAGHYHAVHDEHDGIPLGIYCRRSLAEHLDAEEIFTVTKQGFDFFHQLFDYRYAFGKYDQCFVPEFNAGAMENAGCVTFLEDYVFRSKVTDASYERRAETILHEMAHMWFGDLVTMRWFDDLWLNESFATYASVVAQVEATRWTHAWTTFANVEKTWAYRQDQLSTTHPIAADIEDNDAVRTNFDGITYAKGASVLKQLVHWVGPEPFFHAMRSYFRDHEYANTTLRDLLVELEQASGRDLSAWSKEWLETAGVNTLRARFDVGADGTFGSFAVEQEAPTEYPTLRSHRLAIGLYDRTSEGLLRRERVELDVTGATTEVPQLAGKRVPDLLLINDDDLTYAKIRLDERSQRTLIEHIGELRDSLPRALCWTAAWDMTRDAEMATRDYVDLVLAGVGAESDIGLVQSLQRLAKAALDTFTEPAYRPVGLRKLADASRQFLYDAPAGTDHQLSWVRTFASAAHGDDDIALLRRLLSGERHVDGLTVDTELRWHLLHRLVALGAAGEADLQAELARDNTAQGRRHVRAARAAMPTAEAKRQAWELALSDELPNAEHAAVIGAFMQPDQIELLRPYRDAYFAALPDVWARMTNEMAHQVVVGLYPSLLVEQETITATDEWLAAVRPEPALRRLVSEGRDAVARALRGRERDAASV